MAFPPLPYAFQQYGFQQHIGSAPRMVPLTSTLVENQIDQNYHMASQAPPVLSAQSLDDFDFGRFDDLSHDINQQVCDIFLVAFGCFSLIIPDVENQHVLVLDLYQELARGFVHIQYIE